MIKLPKAIIALTLSAVSLPSIANMYSTNQGINTDTFDSNYFFGQWDVNFKQRPTPLEIFERNPKFVVIYPGDREITEKRMDNLREAGLRTEYSVASKIWDESRSVSYKVFKNKVISENLTQEETFEHMKEYNLMQNVDDDMERAFIKSNGKNVIGFETYSKHGTVSNADVISFFDYRNLGALESRLYEKVQKAQKYHKENFNYDINKNVDLYMLSSGSNLMGVDIISDRKFVLYNFTERKPSALEFTRPAKEYDVKSYHQFFKEFNAQQKAK